MVIAYTTLLKREEDTKHYLLAEQLDQVEHSHTFGDWEEP